MIGERMMGGDQRWDGGVQKAEGDAGDSFSPIQNTNDNNKKQGGNN